MDLATYYNDADIPAGLFYHITLVSRGNLFSDKKSACAAIQMEMDENAVPMDQIIIHIGECPWPQGSAPLYSFIVRRQI